MKDLNIVVEEGKASLFAAEDSLDLTIASLSATLVRVAGDRPAVGIEAHRTQRVMEQGVLLMSELVGSRRGILRYHDTLAKAAAACGASAEAIGPNNKPTEGSTPPPPGFGDNVGGMAVLEQA